MNAQNNEFEVISSSIFLLLGINYYQCQTIQKKLNIMKVLSEYTKSVGREFIALIFCIHVCRYELGARKI